ncbi:membrane protein YdbS with pleckstrin-like domain [Streptomyces glaucescens]
MFRIVRWLLLAAFLITVGLWPAAATPINLAVAGAAVILGTIPAQLWLIAALVAWWRHRPAPAPAPAA